MIVFHYNLSFRKCKLNELLWIFLSNLKRSEICFEPPWIYSLLFKICLTVVPTVTGNDIKKYRAQIMTNKIPRIDSEVTTMPQTVWKLAHIGISETSLFFKLSVCSLHDAQSSLHWEFGMDWSEKEIFDSSRKMIPSFQLPICKKPTLFRCIQKKFT